MRREGERAALRGRDGDRERETWRRGRDGDRKRERHEGEGEREG